MANDELNNQLKTERAKIAELNRLIERLEKGFVYFGEVNKVRKAITQHEARIVEIELALIEAAE